jgi:hypothetical protein
VPQKYLKTIQAGRLKGMSDIKPQWRIMVMTEVFGACGFGWKVGNLKFTYQNGSDNQIVCNCYLELFIKLNDIWSDAIPGVGGSAFIANERNGLYTSDEAEKMAYTDALSVAMKMIGVAGNVYLGENADTTKYTNPVAIINKQPLPADRFEKAKEAFKAGKIDLQKDLIDKFDLTPVQLNELTKS